MVPKAKTIIERHGFKDPDRKNPKHDEIQIWVYQNYKQIITEVLPQREWPFECAPTLEYPITDDRYIIGFADIFVQGLGVGIEIKTEIPVLGDLIRQIQFYRKYIYASWIVVAPDDRFAKILRHEGIHFYKYKIPGELF